EALPPPVFDADRRLRELDRLENEGPRGALVREEVGRPGYTEGGRMQGRPKEKDRGACRPLTRSSPASSRACVRPRRTPTRSPSSGSGSPRRRRRPSRSPKP